MQHYTCKLVVIKEATFAMKKNNKEGGRFWLQMKYGLKTTALRGINRRVNVIRNTHCSFKQLLYYCIREHKLAFSKRIADKSNY